MAMLVFLLYLIAFVSFVLAAFNVAARVNLLAIGLAAWVLPSLITAWPG